MKGIIIEIRAGAGGDEAALFVAELYRMYIKHAQAQGWGFAAIDANPTTIGGFKEISFEINSPAAFDIFKNESGVHRVQRVPKTEKNGRVHTSTVSVAVMPKVEETEVKINPQDLRIEAARSSGPGGQNVNKRSTAVRIVHLPTNIMVLCQTERSQSQNKEKAMELLRAKIYDKTQNEQMDQLSADRRAQIGRADRSEKIRTYNYPQNRITDHRINNLETIMEGDLNPIIKAFREKIKEE